MACIAALLCGTAAQLQGAALVKMLRARDSEWFVRKGTPGQHPVLFCGVRKVAIQVLEYKRAPPPPSSPSPPPPPRLPPRPPLPSPATHTHTCARQSDSAACIMTPSSRRCCLTRTCYAACSCAIRSTDSSRSTGTRYRWSRLRTTRRRQTRAQHAARPHP